MVIVINNQFWEVHCSFVCRCEGQASDSSAPLATDDSDDDISDDETSGVTCEEAFSRWDKLKFVCW